MPSTTTVTALIKEVSLYRTDLTKLTTDMEWVKRGMYLCAAASVSAFLAVIGEIFIKLLVK